MKIFDTVTQLKKAKLTVGQLVQTQGYYAAGDGGDAAYIIAATQTVDGYGDHELANDNVALLQHSGELNIDKFGAMGDGVADDYAAILAALTYSQNIRWGDASKTYRITEAIDLTLTEGLCWSSNGATILVDPPARIKRAVSLVVNGNNVSMIGELNIDCNQKAFSAFYANNDGAFSDFMAKDLKVRNCYRADTSLTGGDGIWIRGAFTKVILENPDVRDIVMATGAGVSGSQGVAGITVSSAGVGLAPQRVDITNAHIENIYSEDVTYSADQDGIRIFTEEDVAGDPKLFEGSFSIRGGSINNCGGRGIKSQMEHGVVDGVKFSRNGGEVAAINRNGNYPEIDFQVGSGIVTNTEYRYFASVPKRVIAFNGTRQAGKYSFGGKIVNANVSSSGSNNLALFCGVSMYEQEKMHVNISNVQVTGADVMTYFVTAYKAVDGAGFECFINIENIDARVSTAAGSAFVYRPGGNYFDLYASGRNLINYSLPAAFIGSTAAGDVVSDLSGVNVRVS